MTDAPRPRRFARRLAAAFVLFLFLAVLAPFALWALLVAPGPLAAPATIVIQHGERSAAIGAQLAQANAVYAGPLFRLAARFIAGGAIVAGEYALPAHASPAAIAKMMHDGRSVVRLFTVPEGLTSAQIAALLNADPVLAGAIATPPEGSLLPETYRYSYGDTRQSLVERMTKAMQEKLAAIWAARDPSLALDSPQQLVTLASIIEKETGKPGERARIAGVFYNRLRLHMRLQSDPTVIYALTNGAGELNRPLTHADLAAPSPVNTYQVDGLPPQPICNPGLAALQAAAHPEHNDFLYFVADGAGGHAFAASLKGQDSNINHWRAVTGKTAPKAKPIKTKAAKKAVKKPVKKPAGKKK